MPFYKNRFQNNDLIISRVAGQLIGCCACAKAGSLMVQSGARNDQLRCVTDSGVMVRIADEKEMTTMVDTRSSAVV
ncbi:hypothetical protein [Kushneria sinocarnis]|uniref:hypothetical protein n=1 Tax=Kushneria sinocarnis TaxID=595502 RepID=UPI0011C367DA|nr:hypothetical protein [Kushneria sinocarnis]